MKTNQREDFRLQQRDLTGGVCLEISECNKMVKGAQDPQDSSG